MSRKSHQLWLFIYLFTERITQISYYVVVAYQYNNTQRPDLLCGSILFSIINMSNKAIYNAVKEVMMKVTYLCMNYEIFCFQLSSLQPVSCLQHAKYKSRCF